VVYFAQRRFYAPLLRAGIEIYESVDDYNHAKLLVVDRRIVMVGSANLDLRSAHMNFEIAAVLPNAPSLAHQVLATMSQRQAAFRRVCEQDLPRHPFVRLVDGFCGLLSPLL
jgi:cardiolipin synthase